MASKRANSNAKGARLERKAKELLEHSGYLVHRAVRTPIKRGPLFYSNSNDVFGVFDLVAIKPAAIPRFIQVTVAESARARMRKIWPVAEQSGWSLCQVWAWAGAKIGFEIWQWNQGVSAFSCGEKLYVPKDKREAVHG